MTTELTYRPVGGSLAADLLAAPPAGYRSREDRAPLGTGDAVFRRASDAVLRWGIQERVGIRVVSDGSAAGEERGAALGEGDRTGGPHRRLRVGDDAVLRIRAYGVTTRAPVRVVVTVDEPRVIGFAYGTRRGHPESGEVAFLVEHHEDDRVFLVVRSFSRPASMLWRVLWPFVQWKSRRTTRRYLEVLAEP